METRKQGRTRRKKKNEERRTPKIDGNFCHLFLPDPMKRAVVQPQISLLKRISLKMHFRFMDLRAENRRYMFGALRMDKVNPKIIWLDWKAVALPKWWRTGIFKWHSQKRATLSFCVNNLIKKCRNTSRKRQTFLNAYSFCEVIWLGTALGGIVSCVCNLPFVAKKVASHTWNLWQNLTFWKRICRV